MEDKKAWKVEVQCGLVNHKCLKSFKVYVMKQIVGFKV